MNFPPVFMLLALSNSSTCWTVKTTPVAVENSVWWGATWTGSAHTCVQVLPRLPKAAKFTRRGKIQLLKYFKNLEETLHFHEYSRILLEKGTKASRIIWREYVFHSLIHSCAEFFNMGAIVSILHWNKIYVFVHLLLVV